MNSPTQHPFAKPSSQLPLKLNPEAPHVCMVGVTLRIMEVLPSGEVSGTTVRSQETMVVLKANNLEEIEKKMASLLQKLKETNDDHTNG